MSEFYEGLQGLTQEVLEEFNQGTLIYLAPSSAAHVGDPWNPTKGAMIEHPVNGTVKGVEQKYLGGTHIQSSDKQCMLSVFDASPTTEGRLSIDGELYEIIRVDKMPAAGAVIAWRLFIRN